MRQLLGLSPLHYDYRVWLSQDASRHGDTNKEYVEDNSGPVEGAAQVVFVHALTQSKLLTDALRAVKAVALAMFLD